MDSFFGDRGWIEKEKIMKDIMTVKLFKGTLFEKRPFKIDWGIK